MSRSNRTDFKTRRATVLSIYKNLIDNGKLKEDGVAMKRYDELLKRRINQWTR